MVNLIKRIILESIKNNIVTCDNCHWQWNLKDGGNDPYVCHKCGHDNNPNILNEKCWKGYTQKGMKTMFGKRYPNCVKITKEEQEDYKGEHTAPSKNYGSPMYDLTDILGDEIYSNKAVQYYGEGYPYDNLAIAIMQSARNKPNKLIKIYRAVPKEVNTINNGDWVTTTLQYAKSHGQSHLNNKFKILSKTVPASTLYSDGGSIHEWGYNP